MEKGQRVGVPKVRVVGKGLRPGNGNKRAGGYQPQPPTRETEGGSAENDGGAHRMREGTTGKKGEWMKRKVRLREWLPD